MTRPRIFRFFHQQADEIMRTEFGQFAVKSQRHDDIDAFLFEQSDALFDGAQIDSLTSGRVMRGCRRKVMTQLNRVFPASLGHDMRE